LGDAAVEVEISAAELAHCRQGTLYDAPDQKFMLRMMIRALFDYMRSA
jgi:hypothetical protein